MLLVKYLLIVVIASFTIMGCAELSGPRYTYVRGWADANGKNIESPEILNAMLKCDYTATMSKVSELRNTTPYVMQAWGQSYDDYLDAVHDAREDLEIKAKENKPKADAMEAAVKLCVFNRGVTARPGWFTVENGVFIPDRIQR